MTTLVLLSGGWESALCTIVAVNKATRSKDVQPVFIDYKQRYMTAEWCAASYIAVKLGTERLRKVDVDLSSAERTGRVVAGRNEAFLRAAIMQFPDARQVYVGVRAPLKLFDKYKDSNAQWCRDMSRLYGVHVTSPCVLYPKWLVKWLVRSGGIDDTHVFSSEGLIQ